MNLVRAELSRLAARRFVQVLAFVLVASFAVTVATTLASSHVPSDREVAIAEEMAREERQNAERYRAECEASGNPDCRYITPPEGIQSDVFLSGVFVFASEIRNLVMFLAAFLTLFGFLVAASYIGAELTSGGMTNLLLWRPERTVVLGTKLGTVLGVVLAVSLVSTVLYVGAFWALANVAGLPGNMTAEAWGELALLSLRGIGLALAATAAGFAIATVGRYTAAALGLVAAYAVLWEIGARIVLETTEASRPDLAMLSTYVAAWVAGGLSLWGRAGGEYHILWWHGGMVLATVTAILLAAAFTTFRRRDLA